MFVHNIAGYLYTYFHNLISMKQNDMWWQKFFVKEETSDANDTEDSEDGEDNESGLYMFRDYSQGTRYAHNYCRDPGNDGYLGCYTDEGYSSCTFICKYIVTITLNNRVIRNSKSNTK